MKDEMRTAGSRCRCQATLGKSLINGECTSRATSGVTFDGHAVQACMELNSLATR